MKKSMGVTEDDPQKVLKDELKHLFGKLCGKLDALCNFHYTPKAAIPEMKVRQPLCSVSDGCCVSMCLIASQTTGGAGSMVCPQSATAVFF